MVIIRIKNRDVSEDLAVLRELRNQGFILTQHEDKFGNVEYHAVMESQDARKN